ncbi:Hypothetical protein I5071_3720 [Sandaracinus amylolyticus]|nr:Hypothetical protein I5071_3720 [Sandaracinus amylolyticus]
MAYDVRQTMLVLGFLSYLGFDEIERGVKGDTHVFRLLQRALDAVPGLDRRWKLVWGPASRRFAFTIFAQNLMFVVRDERDPTHLVVVVRGTNPVSPVNWLVEDFSIARLERWPYAHDDASARVSMGTLIGLGELQAMRPGAGLPGSGASLHELLIDEVRAARGARVKVSVVGHSLGGALAPAVGLWLEDTRTASDVPGLRPWDPERRADVHVFSFGGPTPGNRGFAARYDALLGARTHRVWNPLDPVPHGWERETVARLPRLYEPKIRVDVLIDLVFRVTGHLSHDGDYRHVTGSAPSIEGARLHPSFARFWTQMLYQHSLAYLDLFGVLGHVPLADHLPWSPAMRARVAEVEGEAVVLEREVASEIERDEVRVAGRIARGLSRLVQIPASVLVHALPAHLPLASLMLRGAHHEAQPRVEAPVVSGATPRAA